LETLTMFVAGHHNWVTAKAIWLYAIPVSIQNGDLGNFSLGLYAL